MPLQPPTPVAGRITRRTLLRATTATAVAFAEETPAEAAASLVKGVGISWAPQMEARGYSWKNAGGQTQDLLTILKGYGITAVRLRTFVNPSDDPANGHWFLQSEFGGRVDRASSTRASLVAYTKALKANGGQGIFYWEPECMSPFTGYTMGAWDSSSKRPTAIMNGFTQA
jgi:arabinogalactan endo-1,4-beta-galactosidase